MLMLVALLGVVEVQGGESCCKFKQAQNEQDLEPEYIDDPTDDFLPAVDAAGQDRFIESGCDFKPEDWDSDDDGSWEPAQVDNPDYHWVPRKIPNPKYVPPPTFTEKLRVEILAALPWVTLGVWITGLLSSVLVDLLMPGETMQWWLSSSTTTTTSSSTSAIGIGIGSLVFAALLGLATPLCSCGALPLCTGLVNNNKNKGRKGGGGAVPLAMALAFLTASQSAGLDSATVTYGLLGPMAMIGRLVGAIILALAVSLACSSPSSSSSEATDRKEKGNGSKQEETCHQSPSTAKSSPSIGGLVSTWLETAVETYPTVLVGLTLSTAALHYLPILTTYDSSSDGDAAAASSIVTRLAILASAVPLQLCEHTSVTLSAAIQKAGGSPGLAFAFLLSAPATNLPTLLFLWSHHRNINANSTVTSATIAVVKIVLALLATSLVLSYLVDGSKLDLLAGEAAGEMAILPDWFADSSPYLAGGMVVMGYLRPYIMWSNNSGKEEAIGGDCCGGGSEKTKEE